MKKVVLWLCVTMLFLCAIPAIAESGAGSFTTVDFHPELLFEIPDYLTPIGGKDVVLCFEDMKGSDLANDPDVDAYYGDFLAVWSITPSEAITQENYLAAIQYFRKDMLAYVVELVNQWQAQAQQTGDDYVIMTPGQVADISPIDVILYGTRERIARRTETDLDQPENYQDGIRYAFCYDDLLYWIKLTEKPEIVHFDTDYWVYLYPTEKTLYTFLYVRPRPNNSLDYVDPVVERLFLSVRPKPETEAEKLYEQYLALAEQSEPAALEVLEKAIELNPDNVTYYNSYISELAGRGRFEDALSIVQKALTLEPENPEWYADVSTMLIQIGEFEKSLEVIDEAVAFAPDNASYRKCRANSLNRLERYDEAVEEARIAVELELNNAGYWETLASNLAWKEQFESALASIEQAIALEPNRLAFHRMASVYAHNMGDNEKSLAFLDQAFAISPDYADLRSLPSGELGYADLYYARFFVLNELGRYEEALEAIEHALEIMPSQRFYENYADALFNTAQYDAVVDLVGSLEKSFGSTAYYHALRAESLYCLQAYEKALEDIEAGVKMDDQIGRLYRVGAESLFKLGRYEEALETIDAGLVLMPDLEQYVLIRDKIVAELAKPEDERGRQPRVIITSDSAVNLRSEGNADGKILGKGQSGDVFPCTGTAASGWYEILLPDGQTAYVSNKMAQYEE